MRHLSLHQRGNITNQLGLTITTCINLRTSCHCSFSDHYTCHYVLWCIISCDVLHDAIVVVSLMKWRLAAFTRDLDHNVISFKPVIMLLAPPNGAMNHKRSLNDGHTYKWSVSMSIKNHMLFSIRSNTIHIIGDDVKLYAGTASSGIDMYLSIRMGHFVCKAIIGRFIHGKLWASYFCWLPWPNIAYKCIQGWNNATFTGPLHLSWCNRGTWLTFYCSGNTGCHEKLRCARGW